MPDVPVAILDAAEAAVETYGFTSVTLEEMAAAIGVNRVTLYRRGYTRDGLLAGLAAAAAEEFRIATLPALTDSGTAAHRLEILFDALFDLADSHLALLAGLYDGPTAAFHLSIDDHEALTRLEYTEPIERILADGAIDGTLSSDDPNEDAEVLFNLVGWTYVHLRRSHGWSPTRARAAVRRQLR